MDEIKWELNLYLKVGYREGTNCLVHWVSYANNESWNIISKTKDILYGG